MKNSRIDTDEITLQIRRSAIRGLGNVGQTEMDKPTLDDKIRKKIAKTRMSEDQFIAMREFADMGNRLAGKRQLKLNFPELREQLISDNLERGINPLTDRNGLSSGGKVSQGGSIELLDQRQHLFSIMNQNRLPDNPNPTSFKINF